MLLSLDSLLNISGRLDPGLIVSLLGHGDVVLSKHTLYVQYIRTKIKNTGNTYMGKQSSVTRESKETGACTVWVTKKFLFRFFYKDGIYSCNGNGTVGTRHGPFSG